MNLKVIKDDIYEFQSRFLISINEGTSSYPIVFTNEDDANAFIQWLISINCTNEILIEHIEKLEMFLSSKNTEVARLYMRFWCEKLFQEKLKVKSKSKSLEGLEDNLQLIDLHDELQLKCSEYSNSGSGALKLKPKFR